MGYQDSTGWTRATADLSVEGSTDCIGCTDVTGSLRTSTASTQGIANTFVQLFRIRFFGLMRLLHPIRLGHGQHNFPKRLETSRR